MCTSRCYFVVSSSRPQRSIARTLRLLRDVHPILAALTAAHHLDEVGAEVEGVRFTMLMTGPIHSPPISSQALVLPLPSGEEDRRLLTEVNSMAILRLHHDIMGHHQLRKTVTAVVLHHLNKLMADTRVHHNSNLADTTMAPSKDHQAVMGMGTTEIEMPVINMGLLQMFVMAGTMAIIDDCTWSILSHNFLLSRCDRS